MRPIVFHPSSKMKKSVKDTKIAVVGGGPVGSLCASVLAKRGYDVDLYEYREDIRKSKLIKGRSINLALSVRGRTALREIGLEELIIHDHGIRMKARMIHKFDGSKYAIPYDPVNNQCIYSVSRKYLNEILLTAAEKYPNVKTHFCMKLISASLEDGVMTFLETNTDKVVKVETDLIVGADGAFSSVRKELIKRPLYNFNQQYIEHGYLELCIPPTANGDFAMEENYLHIWPRGTFMMIALPNQDKTWTVTLFMPFEKFAELDNTQKLLQFFEAYLPDAIPLITIPRLMRDFFAVEASPLVYIKCKPYHFKDRALIIGDAAHAIVPFYGQGLNAGFEDCTLLNQLMTKHCDRLDIVLPEFSVVRNPDAEAICDLALYNYIEMRDLVNKKSFLLRKKVDDALYRFFPKIWVPLYNSVTFSNIKYSQCISNRKYQDKIVLTVLALIAVELLWFLYCVWDMFF